MRPRLSRLLAIAVPTVLIALVADVGFQMLDKAYLGPVLNKSMTFHAPLDRPRGVAPPSRSADDDWTTTTAPMDRTHGGGDGGRRGSFVTVPADVVKKVRSWTAIALMFGVLILRSVAILGILYWAWDRMPGPLWWQKGLVMGVLLLLLENDRVVAGMIMPLQNPQLAQWPYALHHIYLLAANLAVPLIFAFGIDRMHRNRMNPQPAPA